jgi:8-oxo-dGTP diphosphatase
MSEIQRPKIGTGVYIRKDGRILLGKRRGSNGAGYYCAPGGHLEMNETWEANARRETMEEAGIEIQNILFMTATNDINDEDGKHYVTLHFVADWLSGEPADVEPLKIGDWDWYPWDALPLPLFLPARNLIKNGYNPLNFTDK